MTEPGTIRTAIPAVLAFATEPSLLNLIQGIVAVVVLPDVTIEKLVLAFREVKLLAGIMSPGTWVIAFDAAFSEL